MLVQSGLQDSGSLAAVKICCMSEVFDVVLNPREGLSTFCCSSLDKYSKLAKVLAPLTPGKYFLINN